MQVTASMNPEVLIIVAIVLLVLFGGRKLPELAKGLGQGFKEFKTAVRENSDEEKEKSASAGAPSGPTDTTPKNPA